MSSRESGSPGAGVGELLPLTPGTSGNSSYLSNSFSSSSVNPESSTDPSPVSGESSPSSPNRGSPSMGGTVDARAAAGSNSDATRPCTRSCRSRIPPNAWKSQSRLLSHIDAQPAKLATRTAIPAMNPFRMVRFPEAMGTPLPVTVGKSAVPVSKVERDFPLRGFGRRLAASADASATAPLARCSRVPLHRMASSSTISAQRFWANLSADNLTARLRTDCGQTQVHVTSPDPTRFLRRLLLRLEVVIIRP